MSTKTFKSIGLLLVILAALGWVYAVLAPKGIDLSPYEMLGAGAGAQTARLLHNSGRVVLMDADFGIYKLLAPTTRSEIASFKKAILKAGLKIAGHEKVAIVPPSMGRVGLFMQPGQMEDLMARHAGVDAIVLFIGLAGPDDVKAPAGGHGKPKLILVSNYEPSDEALLRKGIIQLAIVPRLDAGTDEAKTIHSAKEWFEQHYEALTPEQFGQSAN